MTDQHLDSDGEFGKWSRPPRTTPPVIDRRVLSNGEVEEWERSATIPDDFIYDPEMNAYYPPGEPTTYDAEEALRETQRIIEEARREPPIPAEKLRVPAGVLDVPPEWRKSLGGGKRDTPQRDLFSDLPDDDDPLPEKQPSTPREPDCDASADEVR